MEQRIDVRRAFASPLAYRALLERLLGFHRPLAAQLAPWEAELADVLPSAPPRVARLAADVAALGGAPSLVAGATDLPELASADAALGALYVVEGSALGGTVLARLAARRLGLDASGGAAFFNGDAADGPPPRWTALLDLIEGRGDTGEDAVARVTGGAADTFDALDRWLAA